MFGYPRAGTGGESEREPNFVGVRGGDIEPIESAPEPGPHVPEVEGGCGNFSDTYDSMDGENTPLLARLVSLKLLRSLSWLLGLDRRRRLSRHW